MDGKHISAKQDGVVHCPYCRGVLFKNLSRNEETGETSFLTRCPHCQKNIPVTIQDGQIHIAPAEEDSKE